MTDNVDQPVDNGDSPEDSDLNGDVVERLSKAMDSRFQGFQGILDKNIATLRNEFASQLEEVRRKNLTPEELEDLEDSEKEAENRRLRKEVELLRLRKDHPDEVDFLSEFLNAESFDSQLQLLSAFRKSNRNEAGPTPREEPDADESKPNPVDLNNPNRGVPDSLAALLRGQGEMTREKAQKLLEQVNERGIMARLRRES